MGIIHGGRLRRLALVMSLGVLAALAIAGATSARVDSDSSGSAPTVWLAGQARVRDVLSRRRQRRRPGEHRHVDVAVQRRVRSGRSLQRGRDAERRARAGPPRRVTRPLPASDDVCPNVEGNQATVPADGEGRAGQLCHAAASDGRVSERRRQPGHGSGRLGEGRAGQLRHAAASDGRVSEYRGQPGHGSGRLGEGRAGQLRRASATATRASSIWSSRRRLARRGTRSTPGTWRSRSTRASSTSSRARRAPWHGRSTSRRPAGPRRTLSWAAAITVANPNSTAVTGVSLTDQLPDTTVLVWCERRG